MSDLVGWIWRAVMSVIALATIRIPVAVYGLLSMQITVTVSVTSVLTVAAIVSVAAGWLVRYRLLAAEARLTADSDPTDRPGQEDGGMVPPRTESKPGYIDHIEQLFGYLEPAVFQELTSRLQTRQLVPNEIVYLDDELGFCLVGHGKMEILARTRRGEEDDSGDDDDVDDDSAQFGDDDGDGDLNVDRSRRYRVLAEARSGSPLSSFFSILSLFTEDVPLGLAGMPPRRIVPTAPSTPATGPLRYRSRERIPLLDLDENIDPGVAAFRNGESAAAIQTPILTANSSIPAASPQANEPDIIARALKPTTMVILPASSFHRLTRYYPKATAHIIQVILARFSRATLGTAQNYLGLGPDVMRLERAVSQLTMEPLPAYLRDSGLHRLKSRFAADRDRPAEQSGGVVLQNPRTAHRRVSHALGRSIGAVTVSRLAESGADHAAVSPGDLMGGDSTLARPDYGPFRDGGGSTVAEDGTDVTCVEEENMFRHAVVKAISQAIGVSSDPAASAVRARLRSRPTTSGSGGLSERANRLNRLSRNRSSVFVLADDSDREGKEANSAASAASVPLSASSLASQAATGDGLIDRLSNEVEIMFFPEGAEIVRAGDRTTGMYYIIDGFVTVEPSRSRSGRKLESRWKPRTDTEPENRPAGAGRQTSGLKELSSLAAEAEGGRSSFTVPPGGVVGYLGSVASSRSFSHARAQSDVVVGFLPRPAVDRLAESDPGVYLLLGRRLTALLPRTVLLVDFALGWIHADAGQVVFERGADSDGIYVVLNGRLRAYADMSGQDRTDGVGKNRAGRPRSTMTLSPTAEFTQGDSIGELEVLTDAVRPASVVAVRDSELVKLPKTLFHFLAAARPSVAITMSRTIAGRMQRLLQSNSPTGGSSGRVRIADVRTIAVVAVSPGVPLIEFASRLKSALIRVGTPNHVATLTQAAVHAHVGHHLFSRLGKLKLSQFLSDLEERVGVVVYVADTPAQSAWTGTCITKADVVLLVGIAAERAELGRFGSVLAAVPATAKELVLLYPPSGIPPTSTRRWLRDCPWPVRSHHHVEMDVGGGDRHPRPGVRLAEAVRLRVQRLQTRFSRYAGRPGLGLESSGVETGAEPESAVAADKTHRSDFLRLARHLRGKSIGLVLGGGGARGIAHVGVLRAFDEAGVPIDIVGGTSIGAFVGALYAADGDVLTTLGKTKKFAGRMNSAWRFLLDLTYPTAAYTTGREFNRSIYKTFGPAQIDDFRLRFYCNSTNISSSRHEIHESGYAWRYVRASMSLAGLIPPLCDDGRMLLDGGYVDNLTVKQMSRLGVAVIFAVDVGSLDDDTPQAYGDSLSGLWAVLNRWNPFSAAANPPSLSEIQSRLAYVSSVDALDRAKRTTGCHYLRPDIDPFATLDFGRFEEIEAVGYASGRRMVNELRQRGELPAATEGEQQAWPARRTLGRRASI